MAKKLHYFNVNGLAEGIRYILHYGGHKFEDIRYELEDWPVENFKDILPFGQVPLYEESDRKLNQSIAIARYVGSQSNLVPSDPWEQAVLDAAVHNCYDLIPHLRAFLGETDPKKKKELKNTLVGETAVFFFSRFEKDLLANNGYFNGKLSWADFVFVGIIETFNLYLGVKMEENYPTVKKLIETVHVFPGVKEYISSREKYNLLIFPYTVPLR